MKAGADADLALDPDAAAMHFDEVLGDGEAETGAARFAGASGVHAVEALEDAGLVGGGNADAGIRDSENHAVILQLGAEDDFAAGQRVLDGVVEQVLQNFLQSAAVAGNIRQILREARGEREREFFFGGAMAGGFVTGFHELRDFDGMNFQFQAIRIHLRKFQQIFGEARQSPRVLENDVEEAERAMVRSGSKSGTEK